MYYKRTYILLVLFLFVSICQLFGQKKNVNDFYLRFTRFYATGDFINAETSLLSILESKDTLSKEYLTVIYNNLGALNTVLGRYDNALTYFNSAEKNITDPASLSLAGIYINKARIYGILKESDKAIEYLEQGIKIYISKKKINNPLQGEISTAYLNLGVTYFEKNKYDSALHYLNKSKETKLRFNIDGLGLPYLNIAKIYTKINQHEKAELYFIKSIDCFQKDFGANYYRLVDVYFDYGLYLSSIGKINEAFKIQKSALSLCLKNYGEKHTFVSLAYKHLGDHFFMQKDYGGALNYYQRSIIAVVKNFNDSSIYSNPVLDSVIFDIRLLDDLKQKSIALECFAQQQEDQKKKQLVLEKGFETIELSLDLINKIRSGFVSTESKVYLAENEKETYIFATHLAQQLYNLTKRPHYLQRMYSIVSQSKSALLRNELFENEVLYRSIPDSIQQKRTELLVNIASSNKLVQDELQKVKPNSQRIDSWKTSLFELKRAKEKLDQRISSISPQFENLLHKTEPTSLNDLQSHLKGDETLVEYFLSNHYRDGKRELFIFTVNQNQINCTVSYLDSLFIHQVESIKLGALNDPNTAKFKIYKDFTDALYYMYAKLIAPIKSNLVGRKLIIVPDEEIAYLPFEAFIKTQPDSTQINYEGLQYLIYDYSISYSYTSSLIFSKKNYNDSNTKVIAFSPDYGKRGNGFGNQLSSLTSTRGEIDYILKFFQGQEYFGSQATKANFKLLVKAPAIFHLAMHSMVDSTNSRYSSLVFDTEKDSLGGGKLFNYEVDLLNISSPMVVLSACNTGTGNLYHGEGVMSLTRGFILAGASSVVNTFWDVNDEASSTIMKDFYYFLSKGEEKGDALRTAKLNYLKTTTPTYANPYYWAAYEVMGDKSPVRNRSIALKLLVAVIILGAATYLSYRKWFRRS